MSAGRYTHYKTLVHPEDESLTAEITYQGNALSGKRFTFRFKRDYISGDKLETTPWFGKKHVEQVRELLEMVGRELEAAAVQAKREQQEALAAKRAEIA